VALAVRAAGLEVILTGDLEERGIERLLERLEPSGTSVLKVPHHGARIGPQGLRLVRALKPRVSVIQVGVRNRYGHPHPSTVGALEALSGALYRTDRDGAVSLAPDAKRGLVVTTFAGGAP
jgi:competence protein ComEC